MRLRDYPNALPIPDTAAAPIISLSIARGSQTADREFLEPIIEMPDILPREATAYAPPDWRSIQLIEPTASQLSPRIQLGSYLP